MTTKVRVVLSSLALLAATGCSTAPFQLALWNPVQIVAHGEDVHGVRMTILYGRNREVEGLDVSVGFARSQQMTGVQLGALFNGGENMNGVQISGLGGLYYGDVTGVQIGALANVCKNMTGVQIGAVSGSQSNMTGVQIGVINSAKNMTGVQIGGAISNGCIGNVTGAQIGPWFNTCEGDVAGAQIGGLLNYARSLNGVQIGVINIVEDQWLPFVPLINFSFSSGDAERQPAAQKPEP